MHHDVLLLPYTDTILVEIDYVEGWPPSQFAMDGLKEEVERVTGKAVEIPTPTPIKSIGESYSTNELIDLHLATLDHKGRIPYLYQEGAQSKAILHILYMDGEWEEGPRNNGVYIRVRDSVAVVFKENMERIKTPDDDAIKPHPLLEQERHVLVHETGHALGLVNRGVPMIEPRGTDDECRCHSTKPPSVMGHWVHEEDVVDFAQNLDYVSPAWRFDEYDFEDIREYQRQSIEKQAG